MGVPMLGANFEREIREQPDVWERIARSDKAGALASTLAGEIVLVGLPHRGSTRDQGDDDGYPRIDDGDPATYRKSDPYLARMFTGDPDSAHPQWAVIDFIHPKPVDAIRIYWANPYATRYVVQYWTGGDAIVAQDSQPTQLRLSAGL